MTLLVAWFLAAAGVCSSGWVAEASQMMKDLRQHLLTNYSKHVRPVRHEQTVVVINFSAYLSHLLYLNIKEQVLSTAGSLELVWSDEYLQWNPDQFGNISSVYLSQADVWLPDLVLYNDVNSMKPLRDDNALVVVNNDGTVQWLPGFNANTDCMVDVYRYPFDTQTCSLIFTTWMMTSDHIQVVTETFYTNWSTVNQEYYIASERADPYDETTSYNDYWTQGGNFTLTLKRRVTFHVLSTVLPLLSFSLLTPLAFLVPESGGEKLTLAVSLVLTNQVFLVSLSGSMPTSGDTISLLVLYTAIQIMFGFLALIINALVLYLPNQHNEKEDGMVSRPLGESEGPYFTRRNTVQTVRKRSAVSPSPSEHPVSTVNNTRLPDHHSTRLHKEDSSGYRVCPNAQCDGNLLRLLQGVSISRDKILFFVSLVLVLITDFVFIFLLVV